MEINILLKYFYSLFCLVFPSISPSCSLPLCLIKIDGSPCPSGHDTQLCQHVIARLGHCQTPLRGLAWLLYKCVALCRAVYGASATERPFRTLHKENGISSQYQASSISLRLRLSQEFQKRGTYSGHQEDLNDKNKDNLSYLILFILITSQPAENKIQQYTMGYVWLLISICSNTAMKINVTIISTVHNNYNIYPVHNSCKYRSIVSV